ncbi:MAG: DUF92 domain-containing protein [Candidatus Micrarchaeota archaeon]|nr:DUF92 domain-containing protein [Candidatus Micrarchaeota archaeon]
MVGAFMLDKPGFLLALTMGIIILVLGYPRGLQMLLLMLVFLLVSVIVTKYGTRSKRRLNLFEGERGWKNVISNGLVPTAMAVALFFTGDNMFLLAYVASIASITADKFASELGVFDIPFFLWGMRKVKPGTSGAVSVLGTLASLSGAFVISISSIYLLGISIQMAFFLGLIGFLGGFVDSIFGILEERGIGNKYTTNFICSLAGALLVWLVF